MKEKISDYYEVIEAAKKISVNRDTMYKLCKTKQFPVLTIPTEKSVRYKIEKVGFDVWIKKNTENKTEA